ncbi:DNA ligase D [Xanthobacter autotrophicus DSM 431]|uniref:DNA ligase D n=1 Tax=Xanthobacter nonsaccharivorans TaxID=3119912 RepID=UPI003727DDE7
MADLSPYRAKRDFGTTPEPKGRQASHTHPARGPAGLFVIQKHAARRLHYDLRLEMDGVLKSWAVTRGPSLVPSEKRLAVQVEDHPLDYAGFEGTIPPGQYGAGNVIVWDRGFWTPEGDPHAGYAKGHLSFRLDGEKLHGGWHLVRMAPRGGGKKDNWLLIKAEDADARPEGAPDILDDAPASVLTGRDVTDISAADPAATSKRPPARRPAARSSGPAEPDPPVSQQPTFPKDSRAAPLPHFVPPALATLAPRAPAGRRHVHEIKFDGYRIEARISNGHARLLTRTGLDWTGRFGPEVPAALEGLPVTDALIDGELVVETGNGASDFSALQADLREGRTDRFVYYVFDLLHLDGQDLTGAPLLARKGLLKTLIGDGAAKVRYSDHFEDDGSLVLQHACRLGLEGVVSKLKDAPYRSGRSRDWIKSKCAERQEFVIGGFVPSTTSRRTVGSLVLGAYEKGRLVHVGRVGTGFTRRVAADLHAQLAPDAVETSPFATPLTADEARHVTFLKPDHVAEVEFRSWTADGHLRHAAFRGLREDKPAREVVREDPPSADPPDDAPPRRRVRLTHPDRIYWPDAGLTKEGLADYYAEVWRLMAPFVTDRPLALVRCPEGIGGPRFFQKHPWQGLDRSILRPVDPKAPEDAPYLAIRDLDGLTALVQGAALEIHPFGSTIADWERPDILILDLDPGEGVAWEQVLAAAREVRERLEKAGLSAFVKTSGGKGLHVCAPLKPKADWTAAKAFAKALADAMAADSPGLYVSTIAKTKRKGRILIDYLRNQRGQTAVAPYSTRAWPGAPVSMPLAWEELSPDIGPGHFTALNTPTRLAALDRDPWGEFRATAAPLPPPP